MKCDDVVPIDGCIDRFRHKIEVRILPQVSNRCSYESQPENFVWELWVTKKILELIFSRKPMLKM